MSASPSIACESRGILWKRLAVGRAVASALSTDSAAYALCYQESLQAVNERLKLRSRSSPPDEGRRRSPQRNRRRPAKRSRVRRLPVAVPPASGAWAARPVHVSGLAGFLVEVGERPRRGRVRRSRVDETISGLAVGHCSNCGHAQPFKAAVLLKQ